MTPRFLTLTDVAEVLNVSLAQAKALVRGGDLAAIKVGGRGAWRVEDQALEDYIQRMYARTREQLERDRRREEQQDRQDGRPDPGLDP